MERYWRAKGDLRKKMLEWQSERVEGFRQARLFARRQGASSRVKYSTNLLGVSFGFIFKHDPDVTLWRNPGRGANVDRSCWVPRRSTKAARSLHAELHSIEVSVPSRFRIVNMIGMKGFDLPGVCIAGQNAYLTTRDTFKGHEDLTEVTNMTYLKACERADAA